MKNTFQSYLDKVRTDENAEMVIKLQKPAPDRFVNSSGTGGITTADCTVCNATSVEVDSHICQTLMEGMDPMACLLLCDEIYRELHGSEDWVKDTDNWEVKAKEICVAKGLDDDSIASVITMLGGTGYFGKINDKTNNNDMRKTNEAIDTELVIGCTYKVFKKDSGALEYSSAKYVGNVADGMKFELTNRATESDVTIKDKDAFNFVKKADAVKESAKTIFDSQNNIHISERVGSKLITSVNEFGKLFENIGSVVMPKKYGYTFTSRDHKDSLSKVMGWVKKIQKKYPTLGYFDANNDFNDSIYTVLSNYPEMSKTIDRVGSDMFLDIETADKDGIVWFDTPEELKAIIKSSVDTFEEDINDDDKDYDDLEALGKKGKAVYNKYMLELKDLWVGDNYKLFKKKYKLPKRTWTIDSMATYLALKELGKR